MLSSNTTAIGRRTRSPDQALRGRGQVEQVPPGEHADRVGALVQHLEALMLPGGGPLSRAWQKRAAELAGKARDQFTRALTPDATGGCR